MGLDIAQLIEIGTEIFRVGTQLTRHFGGPIFFPCVYFIAMDWLGEARGRDVGGSVQGEPNLLLLLILFHLPTQTLPLLTRLPHRPISQKVRVSKAVGRGVN